MDKKIIKKNFSKYARYYDRYCALQDLCASRLASKMESNGFSKVLDIGCGTGNYTKLLMERFPRARIKAIDISEEMIKIAKRKIKDPRVEFIVADAEALDLEGPLDFISSNATFQWFEDLKQALLKYKGLLNKDGIISFSTFGPLTFYELNYSLKEALGKGISTDSSAFVKASRIEKILRENFKRFEIEEEIYKRDYRSFKELLNNIKYTGTRGNNPNGNGMWTKSLINRLEAIYAGKFGKIVATYQAFFCKAVK